MSSPALAFNASEAGDLVSLEDVQLTLPSAAGPVDILRGIDLRIGGGETVSIVGPSGAGKTTLMMVVAGLEQPSAGAVRVAGADLTAMSEDQLALFRRDHIGIVFQAFRLVPTMTAVENVAIPLEFAGHTAPFEAARAALTKVKLDHRLHHYPDQLSGGEQQRVAIARAFVVGPKLLLADEPTGNLDHKTALAIYDLMRELNEQSGTAFLVVTHDGELASKMDRQLHMQDGLLLKVEEA